MEDICPYGYNLPHEGLFAPAYYFYQAPLTVMDRIVVLLSPAVDAMGDAALILPVIAAVLLVRGQLNGVEKFMSYSCISWMVAYWSTFNGYGLEAVFAIGDLLANSQVGDPSGYPLIIAFALCAPFLLNVVASWILIYLSTCEGFPYLLYAWATYALYEAVYLDGETGLLMWLHGSFSYYAYTKYGMNFF
jgi:hypothetical protein